MKSGIQTGVDQHGPVRSHIKNPGQSTGKSDEQLGWNPLQRCDKFEDFDGAITEYALPVNVGQIAAAAGAYSGFVVVPRSGYANLADFVGEDALAANDTNYITFSIANRLASGSGTGAMLAATDPNTTKATGGSAIAAKGRRSLTLHGTAANLWVNEGDVIEVIATVTGTLANVVDDATVTLRIATLPYTVKPRVVRTAGTPFVGPLEDSANGEAQVLLSATNEAQIAAFDYGDQRCIPATKRAKFGAFVKFGTVAANERSWVALISDHNATLGSVTVHARLVLDGSMVLKFEGDDNTTDTAPATTGRTLVAGTYYYLEIDMTDRSAVRFFIDGQSVGSVNMKDAAATPVLQPQVGVQKDSGTGVPYVTADFVRVGHDRV